MSIDPVAHLEELAETAARSAAALRPQITEAARRTVETLRAGGTIFFCGNGGSAADAQHMAAEYIVRYRKNRPALRSIALTSSDSEWKRRWRGATNGATGSSSIRSRVE